MHFASYIVVLFLIVTSGRCANQTSSSTSFSQQNLQVSQANILSILYVRSRLACGMECDKTCRCAAFFIEKKEGIVTDKNRIICTILQEEPGLQISGNIQVYLRRTQSAKLTTHAQDTTVIPETTPYPETTSIPETTLNSEATSIPETTFIIEPTTTHIGNFLHICAFLS